VTIKREKKYTMKTFARFISLTNIIGTAVIEPMYQQELWQ
jgi:hypothetical protein